MGLALGVTSCKRAEVAGAEEFVPGIKRWAGPYKRVAEPTGSTRELGSPDITITVNVSTTEFTPKIIRVKKDQKPQHHLLSMTIIEKRLLLL